MQNSKSKGNKELIWTLYTLMKLQAAQVCYEVQVSPRTLGVGNTVYTLNFHHVPHRYQVASWHRWDHFLG